MTGLYHLHQPVTREEKVAVWLAPYSEKAMDILIDGFESRSYDWQKHFLNYFMAKGHRKTMRKMALRMKERELISEAREVAVRTGSVYHIERKSRVWNTQN